MTLLIYLELLQISDNLTFTNAMLGVAVWLFHLAWKSRDKN